MYVSSRYLGKGFGLRVLMEVFFPRRHAAPDMPLRFIRIQHFTGVPGKGGIDLDQSIGDVLMYRTFADTKLLRRLPHCRVVFNNVHGDLDGSPFNIFFQKNPPQALFLQCMQGK